MKRKVKYSNPSKAKANTRNRKENGNESFNYQSTAD
jgi:hypothetical protein